MKKNRMLSVMRKRLFTAAVSLMLLYALTGCGANDSATDETVSAESEIVSETDAEVTGAEGSEIISETDADTDSEKIEAGADEANQENTDTVAEIPEDGVYDAEFCTDSAMFHVNETCDGKGKLTVENGEMTIHVTLVSKNIVNMYQGTAEEAESDEANVLEPTVDTVTYSDGSTEEVYGFDVAVPTLNQEFDLAIFGKKGKWYDHKVSVKLP